MEWNYRISLHQVSQLVEQFSPPGGVHRAPRTAKSAMEEKFKTLKHL